MLFLILQAVRTAYPVCLAIKDPLVRIASRQDPAYPVCLAVRPRLSGLPGRQDPLIRFAWPSGPAYPDTDCIAVISCAGHKLYRPVI